MECKVLIAAERVAGMLQKGICHGEIDRKSGDIIELPAHLAYEYALEGLVALPHLTMEETTKYESAKAVWIKAHPSKSAIESPTHTTAVATEPTELL